ncbi:hypothetical protein O181_046256 [Austropuccinia psidii MF-1]|uniref:Uncharacterized protein n=1 Tax=Austropuccinia psidii MF-1 TaxID=1389203 RepID=A0A9Q3DTU2_9BASI|nr:hypothetical protein [Austropuccinia psidii MF-1]
MPTLTNPYTSAHPLLTMLILPQHPQDMPPTVPPDVHPHPSLHFRAPAAYHAYAPTRPYRYASNARTSYLCSTIHRPFHPHFLPSLCSHIRLIGYGGLLAYNTITEICLVTFSSNRFWGKIGGDIRNLWLGFK